MAILNIQIHNIPLHQILTYQMYEKWAKTKSSREYLYVSLTHFAVYRKLTWRCTSTILQLNNFEKTKSRRTNSMPTKKESQMKEIVINSFFLSGHTDIKPRLLHKSLMFYAGSYLWSYPLWQFLWFPCYRWGNWSWKYLSDLPKVMPLRGARFEA